MEYGKIEPITGDPEKLVRRERRQWPFEALTVGTQFTVAANERNACKMALSRYNKAHGDYLKSCTLDNDDLLVFFPGTGSASPESTPSASDSSNPGELDFVSYLITSLDPLASTTMPLARYGNRYDEFTGWIAKLNASQRKQFAISKDENNIVITRSTDLPNFT